MNLWTELLKYWQPALFAFVMSLFVTFLAIKIFPKLKLMDRPEKYNLKRSPIPYYGGVAIFAVFLASVLIFVPLNKEVAGVLIGAFLIALVGFLDDKFSLSPWIRLFVQFVAGAILFGFGVYILSIKVPLLGTIDFTLVKIYGFPLVVALFTIFWVMAVVNTMNFLDGISGLNSGVSVVAGLSLFFLSVHPGVHENPQSQIPVAMMALILAMVALGFFFFDFPKAKILMGDTGSTFLGFMIATLAIFSGGKVATAFLVLGIPILDMIWVVLRRTFVEKKKFWHGDLKHFHHRLLNLGFSERRVVLWYLAITVLFGVLAVNFVNTQQKMFIILGLIVLMFLLGALVVAFSKEKN